MEEINISRKINNFLREIRKLKKIFTKIEFIIQYGSSTIKNYFFEDSDIDICIYIDDKNENLAKFRLEILTNIDDIFDIQIYQLLPIYVQIEVLKGKVLYVKNIDFLYQIANETIEEFEDFYPLYLDYLNQ